MVRTSWLVRLVLTLVTAINQMRTGADVCDTRKREEKMGWNQME
jgi:hypothetical protein